MKTTFFLIRHGNIELSDKIPGRLAGVHLSEMGRAQARSLVEMLGDVRLDAIYSSPLDRTLETAGPLASFLNIDIIKSEPLLEINFGRWTGMSFEGLEEDLRWKQFHFYRNGALIPGGELMIQVQARMVSELKRLEGIHPGGLIAIVSHNDPIKSVLAHFLGISLDLFLRFSVSTGSVSVVSVFEDSAVVECVNLTENISLKFS